MNLDTALEQIADFLDLDADTLKAYAAEDNIGGWHPHPAQATFPNGSLFGVEGQVLYALVRALQPVEVVELGTFHGASSTHLLSALDANGKGKLTGVDAGIDAGEGVAIGDLIPVELRGRFAHVSKMAQDYLAGRKDSTQTFIFEDALHDVETTRDVWTLAQKKLKPGGVIMSHDAAHHIVGEAVRAGIEAAGVTDYLTVLIEPSDCGLAIWRRN